MRKLNIVLYIQTLKFLNVNLTLKACRSISISLRDREKVNVCITEITELNVMKNPASLAIACRATAGYPVN